MHALYEQVTFRGAARLTLGDNLLVVRFCISNQ